MESTRNGSVRDADQLAAELASVKRELAQISQERDEYRVALYGLLKQQWNHELDPNRLKHLPNRPLRDVLGELFPEQVA